MSYELRNEKAHKFKDSPLGRIPEEWKVVKLGEIIILKNGKPAKILKDGKYPIYGSNGLIGYTDNYFLDGTFILIGRVGASGEIHIAIGKSWASDNCLVGECRSNTNPVFMYYLLKHLELKKSVTQTAQPLITQSFISNIYIPLPLLPEQQKIAEILETVDNAIEKTDKIIEKYKRIKRGLMQDLLTKGIVENYESGMMNYELRNEKRHKFKDSPLGRIPEEWNVVRLGEVGDITYGEGLNQNFYEPDGDSVIYGTGGILGRTKLFLNKGPALVIPRKGSINSVFYINEDQKFWVIDTAFYLKIKNAHCKFIYYSLCSINLELLNEATGVPSLNRENINSIQLPLPPLPEQKRIASILSQVDETIEKEQKYKEKLERIKKGLMEDLLTGKVRVNEELGIKN